MIYNQAGLLYKRPALRIIVGLEKVLASMIVADLITISSTSQAFNNF